MLDNHKIFNHEILCIFLFLISMLVRVFQEWTALNHTCFIRVYEMVLLVQLIKYLKNVKIERYNYFFFTCNGRNGKLQDLINCQIQKIKEKNCQIHKRLINWYKIDRDDAAGGYIYTLLMWCNYLFEFKHLELF